MSQIVGIGGMPRSGKDTLAELFMENGYFGVSFGDIVRKFSFERHQGKPDPISVANMTDTSNWLRNTRGADVVLVEALKQFEEAKKQRDFKGVVLYSVRAPVEVDFILARGGEMIWVEASDEVRYGRDVQHRREGEAEISFDEFKRQESLQWQPQPGIPVEAQMNIAYVKEHATKVLENNSDNLDDFLAKAKKLLEELSGK